MKENMIKAFIRVLLTIGCTAGLVGCAGNRGVGLASGIELANLSELPVPVSATGLTVQSQETIEVIVAQSEMLSGTFLIDDAGYISYPLVGDLYVADKTPRQVGKMIADRLRGEFVLDPQVRVRPSTLSPPNISIGGEVKSPGTYPSAASQTLVRAVNNAGGLSEYAKKDDVLIMRTVEGRRYIGVYNIEAIQRGNYADPAIYPGDIVTVGDSPARRSLDKILGIVPLVLSSLVLVDRTVN